MCHLFSFLTCRACCSARGGVLVRAGRTCCFVCHQRAMSVRRLHAVVLGSSSSRCLCVPRVVRARSRAVMMFHACILSRSANSSRLESLIFKLLI
jgi:hypothetical protein